MIESQKQIVLRPHLMYPDRDFDLDAKLPANSKDILADLGLHSILDVMSNGNASLREISRNAILQGMDSPSSILYRQEVVKDALKNRDAVRNMRSVIQAAVRKAKEQIFWLSRSDPSRNLRESVSIMRIYLTALRDLRGIAEASASAFRSEGFRGLFRILTEELDEAYLTKVSVHLHKLTFPGGVNVLCGIGRGSQLTGFRLLKPENRRGIRETIGKLVDKRYTYIIPDRDEQGPREVASMRNISLRFVTRALAASSDNLLGFINTLLDELSFLVACINLNEHLVLLGVSTGFPTIAPDGDGAMKFTGLQDAALSILLKGKAVPNDMSGGRKQLALITGPNRGGKSTFLRSVGQAILMMNAGMFVAAESFSSPVYGSIFTHFSREEDRDMIHGRFDEELSRMSDIIGMISEGDLVLLNESFSSTNAKEGSEIAWQVVHALLDRGITVLFVTHLYELAEMIAQRRLEDTRFLVAERLENGERTFRIVEGEPESTSHGEDIFRAIFGRELETSGMGGGREPAW